MRVWHWLEDSPLSDPVERKLAPILQLTLIGILVALGVALVVALIQIGLAGIPASGLAASVVFTLICLGAIVLVRRGYFKAGAWVLLLLIFFLNIERLVQATPQTSVVALMTFFLPLVIAGAFLGRKTLIVVLLISCGLAVIPAINEKLSSNTVMAFILNAALVSFVLDLLRSTLRDELHTAMTRNAALEQAQRALETASAEQFKLNERLMITLKSIGDAVITTDATGHVTLLNGVAERLTGWTQAEAAGQPLTTVFRIVNEQTRQTVESPADKVIREGVIVGLANHTILLAKDGREIPIDDSGAPIMDSSGKISGVVLVFRDIIERRKAEAQERDLITVNERQRFARELHDSVSQTLYSANLIAESLPRMLETNPERAMQQLEEIHELTQGATSEMRTLLLELRPENISKSRLRDLLPQLLSAAQARVKVTTSVVMDDDIPTIPDEVRFTIYRIAQESLNNIVQHSEATQVRIRLRRRGEGVELVVVDNGQGFDTGQTYSGLGLTSIRERAASIGAQLSIRSKAGLGTRVKVVWQPTKVGS